MARRNLAAGGAAPAIPTSSDEIWRAECRICGAVEELTDREAAHGAALEHMADTGHVGDLTVSGHFEVWRADASDRSSFRPHRMTIGIGLCPDGSFAA